ncbi:hypothetical protein JTB14_032855 [Gonioctena quinquepunctata]|nr:hypothetical protein JTB14_032855 [Gonioctena quinquepunctata]
MGQIILRKNKVQSDVELWPPEKSFHDMKRKLVYMEEKWVLWKLDIQNQVLILFNPYGTKNVETDEYLDSFREFLAVNNVKKTQYATSKPIVEEGWKALLKKHYTVQFPFECGIFILHILDILTYRDTSADSKLEESMDFDELCGYFRKMLFRFSANVMDFCLICRKFETKGGMEWLACDICDRWVHLKCNPTDMNKEELHDSEDFVYYCPTCNRNFGVKSHWKTGYKLNKQKEDLTKILFFENSLIKNPRYYVKSNYLVYQTDMILYNPEKFHVDYFKGEFFDEICEKINIIPLLHAGHYTLILTDFPKQTFTYIDPFGSKEDMNIDMFDRLNCFFKLLNKQR